MSNIPANLRQPTATPVAGGGPVELDLSAKATGTAGVVEASTTAPADLDLYVQRIFIRTNSTTPTSVTVLVDETTRSYSDEGDLNEAEYDPPIWVPAGSALRLVWEGGTAPAGQQLQAIGNVQARRAPRGR